MLVFVMHLNAEMLNACKKEGPMGLLQYFTLRLFSSIRIVSVNSWHTATDISCGILSSATLSLLSASGLTSGVFVNCSKMFCFGSCTPPGH